MAELTDIMNALGINEGQQQPAADDVGAEVDDLFTDLLNDTHSTKVEAAQGGAECAQCHEAIAGRCITAVNKKWHQEHFLCAQCFNPFPNGQYFEFGGKPYCEFDFQDLFGPRCAGCKQAVTGRCVTALDKKWHPEHFSCINCNAALAGQSFVEREGRPFCKNCQNVPAGIGPGGGGSVMCSRCQRPITGEALTIQGQKMHPEHFQCAQCQKPFTNARVYEHEGKLYCEPDYKQLLASCCGQCRRPITGRCVTALNKQWHPNCFVCAHCEKGFAGGSFFERDGRPYCDVHYHQLFGTVCAKCNRSITGRGVTALGKQWHPEHFTCVGCSKGLAGGTFCEWDQKPMCKKCFLRLPAHLRRKIAKKE